MSTDTPRTDAVFKQFGPVPHPAAMAYNSLCRELERELAEACSALHAMSSANEEHHAAIRDTDISEGNRP
jgi:hypothetical protein